MLFREKKLFTFFSCHSKMKYSNIVTNDFLSGFHIFQNNSTFYMKLKSLISRDVIWEMLWKDVLCIIHIYICENSWWLSLPSFQKLNIKKSVISISTCLNCVYWIFSFHNRRGDLFWVFYRGWKFIPLYMIKTSQSY